MITRQEIEEAIAVLEAQQAALGETVVTTTVAALRYQLTDMNQHPVDPAALHGERKQVTVMFADISGFTAMSEKLDPEEVRSMINACFERLGDVVDRYGGHIDKFIGDEIMALFGAPQAHENDPERALRTALDMVNELEKFNEEHADKIPKPLRLHFGINTGLVIAGGIGTAKRQDYSVMGDTVNLASRLEGLSEAGEILVGEDTYRLTAPLFEFEALKPVKVKGKAQPVRVYRLIRARAITGGQIRGVEGLYSPIVGREGELAQLQALYTNLLSGRGGIMSIIGEAGLGKSRLIAELYDSHQHQDETRWAKGRALSHAQNASYLVVRHVIYDLLDLSSDALAADIDSALRADVDEIFPNQSVEIYPYLAALLDLPLDNETAQRVKYLDGEALRQRIRQACQMYLLAKTKQTPLVLVWDDLHWADPSSLELLESLLPFSQEGRLVFVLMYRPRQESRVWACHTKMQQILQADYSCIELPPLQPEDSRQLLKNLLKTCTLPEDMEQIILNKAEGNPFYLEEMIRSLINRDIIRFTDDQNCIVTAEVKHITIPDTLQGVIMSRIDQLDPEAKRTLQVASVIGRVFSHDALKNVVGQTEQVNRQLESLIEQGLIVSRVDAAECKFKHVFTQESIYQSLLLSDRRNLHQKVGEALEVIFASKLDEQTLLLAHHFEKSNDTHRALKYLKQAAAQAFAAYANREATDLYTRSFALLDRDDYSQRWDILAYREQALNRLGERDQQATDLTLMQTLAELIGDDQRLATTHNRRAAYFDKISEYQASNEAATAGRRAAQRAKDAHLEAESLNYLALSAWRRFDYRQVQAWASQALDALKIIGDPPNRITSLLHLGRASYRLGQYDNALEYIRAAQSIANNMDNRDSDALADLILGWIYQRLGAYDDAATHYKLMYEKRCMIGDRYGEATALSHLGWLASDQHTYEQGLTYCKQALEISQSIADRENEAYALSGLALNHEQLGEIEIAKLNYEAALDLHLDIGATTLAIFDRAGLARIALAQQSITEAREIITKVSDWILAGKAQQFWDPWTIYLSAYEVLTALNDTETANAILEEAHTILHQRAKEISNEQLRQRFLENVEVNQKISLAWQEVSTIFSN